MYPRPIEQLIRAFMKLPSVGSRTAERFVFYILKSGKKDAGEIALALKYLIEKIKSFEVCFDFSDQSPCHICCDNKRDHTTICVVSDPQDVQAIEKTNIYRGLYHVLRGTIRSLDEESIHGLKLPELIDRVKKNDPTEIILALNSTLDGENTMMLLEKRLHDLPKPPLVSRLARGLPMGSDVQYADEITLGSALKHRQRTL